MIDNDKLIFSQEDEDLTELFKIHDDDSWQEVEEVSTYEMVQNYLDNFVKKYDAGFTKDDINVIINYFDIMNMSKFQSTLEGITGIVIEGEFVTYYTDVHKAILCGLENRDLTLTEWD